LYRAMTSIWGMLTKVTEWPTVTQSNGGHGSGKESFFYLLIMIIVSIFLLLTTCGAERTHRNFQLALVRNLIENVGNLPRPHLPLATRCSRGKSDLVQRKFQQLLVISFLLNCQTCFAWEIRKRVRCGAVYVSVLKFTAKDANCNILRSAGRFWSHKKSHQIDM
jgi:hypothetical protein